MNIDWSKAPEGATHFDTAGYRTKSFMKLESGDWYFWSNINDEWRYWGQDSVDADTGPFVPRPATADWNGEGLPPVGTVCEYRVGSGTWYPCTIRYITTPISDEEVQVVVHCPHLSGDQIGGVGTGIGGINFRPILTPEQIAAEKREKAAAAMSNATQGAKDWAEAFRMLHDAGYRKFEIV